MKKKKLFIRDMELLGGIVVIYIVTFLMYGGGEEALWIRLLSHGMWVFLLGGISILIISCIWMLGGMLYERYN